MRDYCPPTAALQHTRMARITSEIGFLMRTVLQQQTAHLGNWDLLFCCQCVCVCLHKRASSPLFSFVFFLRIKPIRRRERADGGGHVERSPQDDEEGSRPGDSPRKQIWTVIKRDGPNHLGFWLIRQIWTSSSMMALITPSWSI